MSKYSGKICFSVPYEKSPGVWKTKNVIKPYRGFTSVNKQQYQSNGTMNEDIVLRNEITVVSDMFLKDNIEAIKYVTFQSSKWKVTSVVLTPPEARLTLGGLYHDGKDEK